MNILKGIVIFGFMVAIFGSCFDPPEFPDTPEIEFEKIEFVDCATDSLVLYIHFKDGDGDLGLDNKDLNYISYPYNNSYYYQENNGLIDSLYTIAASSETAQYEVLNIPDPTKGKLVFPRTRTKPGYEYLPGYNCVDYEYLIDKNLLVEEADLAVLDDKVRIVDTVFSTTTTYYQIQDTLYVKTNPNHYNIEIDFLVKEPGNPEADEDGFVEFDWRKEFCTQSYDGRFPVLSQKTGALEGTLRYTMNSVGLSNVFSIKVLKLRVQIKDRALHRSNVIEVPEFTLDKIRKGC